MGGAGARAPLGLGTLPHSQLTVGADARSRSRWLRGGDWAPSRCLSLSRTGGSVRCSRPPPAGRAGLLLGRASGGRSRVPAAVRRAPHLARPPFPPPHRQSRVPLTWPRCGEDSGRRPRLPGAQARAGRGAAAIPLTAPGPITCPAVEGVPGRGTGREPQTLEDLLLQEA